MNRLLRIWKKLNHYPGGNWLFSKLIARIVPYTGSMGARVQLLEPGHCRLLLKDRRKVRNHLNSIHAIALANIGEATGGLALMAAIPENGRAILVKLSIEYLKKARGDLTSAVQFTLPEITGDMDYEITTKVYDQANNVVATATALWRLGVK